MNKSKSQSKRTETKKKYTPEKLTDNKLNNGVNLPITEIVEENESLLKPIPCSSTV